MNVNYYALLSGKTGDAADDYNWQTYEAGTIKEPDWLTYEEYAAKFPAPAPEPPTLEEARAAKLAEINAAFERAGETGHVMSSLGFEIDANARANRDTEGLITVLSATGAPGTMFCDYNNVMREVTLEQLKTLRLEIIAHGQALYAKKWVLREIVNAAQTVAEIQAVVWED